MEQQTTMEQGFAEKAINAYNEMVEEKKMRKAITETARRDVKGGKGFNPRQPENEEYFAIYATAYNRLADEPVKVDGPFAGLTDAEIDQKMEDDIAVEILVESELNGETDGFPEIPDEAIAAYEEMEYDESGLKNNGFPELDGVEKIEMVVNMDDPAIKEKVEESEEATPEIADDPKGWKWAAGNFLVRGEISQADYQRIFAGEMNPDLAKKRVHFGIQRPATVAIPEETEENKKNSRKKNSGKRKAAPKSVTWTIWLMDESGKEREEVLAESEDQSKHGGGKGIGEYCQKLANERGRNVRQYHDVSGRFYTKKPQQ